MILFINIVFEKDTVNVIMLLAGFSALG